MPAGSACWYRAPTTRSLRFQEKPPRAEGLPDDPDQVFASMGNYVFTRKALEDAVRADANNVDSAHDMGGNIITMLVNSGDAAVYDFADNVVPGSHRTRPGALGDVGTLDKYYQAHMDLVSVHPMFNLYNRQWPIRSQILSLPPAKFVFDDPDWPGDGRRLRGERRCDRLWRYRSPVGAFARRPGGPAGRGRGLGADA